LQLLPGAPDRRVLVSRILEFQHGQRQAVDEHHNVRPPVVLCFDHRELIHRQPVVGLRIGEIHQAHMIARDGAVGAFVFHFYAIAQPMMEGAVVGEK
jgi:hypothetical protein